MVSSRRASPHPHPHPRVRSQGLSQGLRVQLVLHLYKGLLEKVPFFQNKAPAFIVDVVRGWGVREGTR